MKDGSLRERSRPVGWVVAAKDAVDGSLRLRSAPVVVAGAVIVSAAVYLTWLASRLWFWFDDWAFLLHRSVTGPSEGSLLEPHNEHWTTVPILVYRVLFAMFGLRHYLPYAMVTIGLHLAVCVLLALMLRRTGAHPWVCVLVLTVMAFLGPGGLDILWAFQMGFLGPAALALACLILVDMGEDPPRFPVLAWVLLVLALMFSGAGLVALAWVSTYCLMRRGLRVAVTLAAPPAAVYLAWYASYGHGHRAAPSPPLDRILPFVLNGTTNLWDKVLPLPGLGMAVLVMAVLVVTLGHLQPRLRMFAAAGLVALVFDFLLLAVARAAWGVETAVSTRYLYLGLLLTMPAVGAALQLAWSAMSSRPVVRSGVWVALAMVFVISGSVELHRVDSMLEASTHGLRERAVAASTMVEDHEPLLSSRVDPLHAPDLDTAALARPSVRRALPDITPGPQAVLDVAANLKVGVSDEPFDVGFAEEFSWRGGPHSVSSTGSCRTVVARAGTVLVLPPRQDGSQVRLVVSQDEVVTTLAVGRRRSMGVGRDVVPAETIYVATTDDRAALRVTVPSGEVSVCLAAPGSGG